LLASSKSWCTWHTATKFRNSDVIASWCCGALKLLSASVEDAGHTSSIYRPTSPRLASCFLNHHSHCSQCICAFICIKTHLYFFNNTSLSHSLSHLLKHARYWFWWHFRWRFSQLISHCITHRNNITNICTHFPTQRRHSEDDNFKFHCMKSVEDTRPMPIIEFYNESVLSDTLSQSEWYAAAAKW